MAARLLRALIAGTWLGLLAASPAAAVDDGLPHITVSIVGQLPAPGTTGSVEIQFDNVGSVEATFTGPVDFGTDPPAQSRDCDSPVVVPTTGTASTSCTVESAADACDQQVELQAFFGESTSFVTVVFADFESVELCPPGDENFECQVRFEPPVGHVGDAATLIATGYTPNGNGFIVDDDPENDFVNSLFHDSDDVPFNASGTFEVTFEVEPFLLGQPLVVGIGDDPSPDEVPCFDSVNWTVIPDTSTLPAQPRRSDWGWAAVLAGVIALGLMYRWVRLRRIN